MELLLNIVYFYRLFAFSLQSKIREYPRLLSNLSAFRALMQTSAG